MFGWFSCCWFYLLLYCNFLCGFVALDILTNDSSIRARSLTYITKIDMFFSGKSFSSWASKHTTTIRSRLRNWRRYLLSSRLFYFLLLFLSWFAFSWLGLTWSIISKLRGILFLFHTQTQSISNFHLRIFFG